MKLHIADLSVNDENGVELAVGKEVSLARTQNTPVQLRYHYRLGIAIIINPPSIHLVDIATATLVHTATFVVEGGEMKGVKLVSSSKESVLLMRVGIHGIDLEKYFRVTLNEDALIPYLRKSFPHNRELIMGIAGRSGLPGASRPRPHWHKP